MDQFDILLLEYTEIMLGNKRHFSEAFFTGETAATEQKAIAFIRMIAKVYLQIDNLQQARAVFNDELIKKMRLESIVAAIRVPDYIDSHDRTDFIAAKIFSKRVDPEKWAAERYCSRVISGSLSKFPRNYMEGEIGVNRARYCLRYFLTLERPSANAFDLLHFSSMPEFRIWLQKHLLMNVCARYYETRVDYMYDSMPDDMRIDIIFMMCKTSVLMERASGEVVRD